MSKTRALHLAAVCLVPLAAVAATAAPLVQDPDWSRLLDNDLYRLSADVRTRMELADFEGLGPSEAYTTRARLGIRSKPRQGLSGFAQLESIWSYDNDGYWDVVTLPNRRRQTPIADPPETDLNQLFLAYENPEWFGLAAKVGRQRILLDDVRFIGNVGWRQNEQTYDAIRASTSFGLEGLTATYGYVRDVHRVFGNKGAAATRDFDSDSHLANVRYTEFGPVDVTAFAYLLDFKSDAPVFSSNSYGLRVTGEEDLAADWKLTYAGSYAFQEDAGRNPVNYEADYVAAEGRLAFAPAGAVRIGYELLGSDAGRARFVTPLATAHKFNGFADVFTNNGGVRGLQDLYAGLAPELPWKLRGELVYHHFWSDDEGTPLGDEVDVVLRRPINDHLTVLTKGAFFESKTRALADGWRYWLEFTFRY